MIATTSRRVGIEWSQKREGGCTHNAVFGSFCSQRGKMRKPDPPEGTPAPAPPRRKKSSASSRKTAAPAALIDDAAEFADAEGGVGAQGVSAAATYVRRHTIAI